MKLERRRFVVASALAACVPLAAKAQAKKLWRVATVFSATREASQQYADAVLAGMQERGYTLGRDFLFDVRYADGQPARGAALVDELVALQPDVLIGASSALAALMRSRAPRTPIVLATSGDAVADGLVQSLARPGGNITGLSLQLPEIGAKHIELMSEALPGMRRVALLVDPGGQKTQNEKYERFARAAAEAKGLSVRTYAAEGEAGIAEAFKRMQEERPEALVMLLSPRLNGLRREVIRHATSMRLPSIAHPEHYALDGGLMAYGPSFTEAFRRVPHFVDRIVKGAKPSELPVEQPSKFDFVVNLGTAKKLGVALGAGFLVRADRIIQ